MTPSFMVRLNREHTYRHLYALCQNDALFTIIDYGDNWNDEDFERIVISDAQALKTGTQRAVIGTVRLLPYDNGTVLMFVNKDAIWHSEVTESDKKLFARFIERASEHFEKLDLLLQKTTEVQKVNKDLNSGREQVWKVLISIILLGFALTGFIWLPWYSAILWLMFWVIAYPVALAFTAAKQSMDNRNLEEMYKAGLMQVPFIGKLFSHKP